MTRITTRGLKAARYRPGKYDGYGMPRGPLGTADVGPTCAIGFCPMCGENARGTTAIRGVYDCPTCTLVWYDERVGVQPRTFDDFFTPVDDDE